MKLGIRGDKFGTFISLDRPQLRRILPNIKEDLLQEGPEPQLRGAEGMTLSI